MSDTNLVTTEMKSNSEIQIQEFNNHTLELIKNTVAPKTLNATEFDLFIYQAKRTGLDPLSRQIYCIKNKEKVSIQATIDGLRLIAERTGHYRGQTPVMWCGDDGKWVDVWLKKENPAAAKVGILRKDFDEPITAIARWDTYAQKNFDGKLNYAWTKMGDLMLGKCAEALGLRKAFPQELSNIYSSEEMGNFYDEEEKKPVAKSNGATSHTVPGNPFKEMQDAKSLEEVQKIWFANTSLQKDEKFLELKEKKKTEFSVKKEEKIDIKPEDVVTEKEQVKRPPTHYKVYSDAIAECDTVQALKDLKNVIEGNDNLGLKDFEDLNKIIDAKIKRIGAKK